MGVMWMIFSECCDRFHHACDTCCSPTLSETKHPSIIFCNLTVSSPSAFDFSRFRKVQVRYSKFTNCSSSPRPQRIPTNLGNRLEHFRFAGPAPRSAKAPGFSQVNRMWFHGSKSTRSVTRYSKNRGL